MVKFDSVYIIYNPNSTGNSEDMAKRLRLTLEPSFPKLRIECIATEYAGHATELAREIGLSEKRPLIISSSGDGGYNEVINGVMQAGNPNAVTAVLPAGNANDHSRTMQDQPLSTEIKKGKVTRIDLIRVSAKSKGRHTEVRYAHSYVGLGLTPVIAAELNEHSLNAFREIILVLKTFYKFRPFRIMRKGRVHRLDSLLFANINQMAKVLTLAVENRPDDGKFEVITFPSGPKRKIVKRLVKAAVGKLETKRQQRVYKFRTLSKIPMQLDGEVIELKNKSEVVVECLHKALRTVI